MVMFNAKGHRVLCSECNTYYTEHGDCIKNICIACENSIIIGHRWKNVSIKMPLTWGKDKTTVVCKDCGHSKAYADHMKIDCPATSGGV